MSTLHRFNSTISCELTLRMRSHSFWIALLIVAALTWHIFPLMESNYLSLNSVSKTTSAHEMPKIYRGQYSSAWIALCVGYIMTLFATTTGFFYIRGSITRDIETQVWLLLGSSAMKKFEYVVARWLSYLIVFTLFFVCSVVTGIIIQWVRGESSSINFLYFFKAYAYFYLPAVALTSALAILFDTQVYLRHSLGNIVYSFLLILLAVGAPRLVDYSDRPRFLAWIFDLSGYFELQNFIASATIKSVQLESSNILIGALLTNTKPNVFTFENFAISTNDYFYRYSWIVVAITILWFTSSLLTKFVDQGKKTSIAFDKMRGAQLTWLSRLLAPIQRNSWGIIFASEFLYFARSRGAGWWLSLCLVWSMQIFGEISELRPFIFSYVMGVALCWILLLDILSTSMLREIQSRTFGFVFNLRTAKWQLPLVRLLSIFILSWICTFPAFIRAIFFDPQIALNIFILDVSIVLFASTVSALMRSGRLFELIACALVYATYEGAGVLNVVNLTDKDRLGFIGAAIVCALVFHSTWCRLRASV